MSPPTVRFTAPSQGEHVHETITIGIRAQDRFGSLRGIDLLANGVLIASSPTDPLSIKWDTRNIEVGGPAELEAVATDDQGNQSRARVQFVIDRGTLPIEKEASYSLINEGTLTDADKLLLDVWDLGSRSQPVHIAPITWREDPFDKYWRFLFYGLRPLADLTWAYYATGDVRYRDKLLEILTSYVNYDETREQIVDWSFDDKHTAAFRAMAVVNSYGKLQRSGDLSPVLGARLRQAALKLGGFLANPRNFDDNYNHGFTEAAALLLVAVNFPDSSEAAAWQTMAISRLDTLMAKAVDGDDVEVEKSPFYHFYVMNFANEIGVWASRFGVPVSDTFVQKASHMTRYATYIAHPNGQVPLIGASVDLNARRQSPQINRILGRTDPAFEYMRTGGRAGVEPTLRNVLFRESGHSILRSAFGASGEEFDQQTHIVFNLGPYRTSHSHLDGLSLVYASGGDALLVDSGLFAYEDGPGVEFFRSTPAHNTVVVDGLDQAPGTDVVAGVTLSGSAWEYQSGLHRLYGGVSHRRAVLLLQRDLTLVLDRLDSETSHDYAQVWHFLPEGNVVADASGATVTDESGKPLLMLQQGLTEGVQVSTIRGAKSPKQGWYSPLYATEVENSVATYHVTGNTGSFVTLIASGDFAASRPTVSVDLPGNSFRVLVCSLQPAVALAVSITSMVAAGEAVSVEAAPCP